MTVDEAMEWLHVLKWMLLDDKNIFYAGEVEDIELRLRSFTREDRWAYSYYLLPNGRRGHITLVLSPPYRARFVALLAGILRSID